jgi:DNA (cytosine-5)-methyltransferase 1
VDHLWPKISELESPKESLDAPQETWAGFDRKRARKLLSLAEEVVGTDDESGWPQALVQSSAPPALRRIALLTAAEEPPLITSQGVLRVAARWSGTDVSQRNQATAGRIVIARMVGAGETARFANAALIELARSVCTTSEPACGVCPLADTCPHAGADVDQLQLRAS